MNDDNKNSVMTDDNMNDVNITTDNEDTVYVDMKDAEFIPPQLQLQAQVLGIMHCKADECIHNDKDGKCRIKSLPIISFYTSHWNCDKLTHLPTPDKDV